MTYRSVRNVLVGVALVLAGFLMSVVPAQAAGANPNEAVDTSMSAAALAQRLVGSGVVISNVQYTGAADARGTFAFTDHSVTGMSQGAILSSGNAHDVVGPNTLDSFSTDWSNAGDPDLDVLSTFPTHDAAVLEFDFIPAANQVSFQYAFSSDEYSEWVNTQFNDVFAFFINGTNCAEVRQVAGDPVSPFVAVAVNNINNSNPVQDPPPVPMRPDLFRANDFNPNGPSAIDLEMDGITRVLTCQSAVNPGVVNHMKLAIADASDGVWDSAVFIEAGSLVSNENPTADLGLDPSHGPAPLNVTASVEGHDPNHLPLTYTINWGDGTSTPSQPLTDLTALTNHTYQYGGTYLVVLTVSNGILTGTDHDDVEVSGASGPTPTPPLGATNTPTDTPVSGPTETPTPTVPPQCHDLCTEGPPLSPSCDPCAQSICAVDVDPYCCDGAWDAVCVSEVASVCGGSCAAEPPTPTETPTETPTDTPTPTPTVTTTATPTATLAMHDAVVLPVAPINVTIPKNSAPPPKIVKVKVKVRNADPSTEVTGDLLLLTAESVDCPSTVIVGPPDFLPSTASADNPIVIPGGTTKTATVPVTVNAADFRTFNHKAPNRCTLRFSVAMPVPGTSDPTPNNVVTAELNVIDKNDPESASPPHESLLKSIRPLRLTVSKKAASPALAHAHPVVLNADILPTPDTGDVITVSVDPVSCPWLVPGVPDMDKATHQPAVTVNGGKSAAGKLQLQVLLPAVTTPNADSPARCTVVLHATGPSTADSQPSNNQTTLTVDVIHVP